MKAKVLSLEKNNTLYVLMENGYTVNSHWTDEGKANEALEKLNGNGINSCLKEFPLNPDDTIIVGTQAAICATSILLKEVMRR